MTKSKKRPTLATKAGPMPHIQYEVVDAAPPSPAVATKRKLCVKKSLSSSKKTGNVSLESSSSSSSSFDKKPPLSTNVTNIILHLRCSMQDLYAYNEDLNQKLTDPLTYSPSLPPETEIKTYHKEETFAAYDAFQEKSPDDRGDVAYQSEWTLSMQLDASMNGTAIATSASEATERPPVSDAASNDALEVNMAVINTKLKLLKIALYKNNIEGKKSACFWCTCDFDNEACVIPKQVSEDVIQGYGSFCRPECAAAHLMKEHLDDSMKFERYHLLNQIYGKLFEYKVNIKPAPDPFYLLDKYYGTLTIQEYRKLLNSNATHGMLLVLERPLTRTLPELHEDFVDHDSKPSATKTGDTGVAKQIGMYRVKLKSAQSESGPSKTPLFQR